MKYTATIVRDSNGVIHIRISKQGPQIGGTVNILKILQGDDPDDLRRQAIAFVNGSPEPDWGEDQQLGLDFQAATGDEPKKKTEGAGEDKPSGFHTAYFFLTKDRKRIKVRFVNRPADDELNVIDVLNGSDPKELRRRSFKYLVKLKRQYGLIDGPNLP